MSTDTNGDRILAKCDACGHTAVASVENGALRPIDNKPGTRCPNCGGTALSAHPLLDDEDRTAETT